MIQMTLIQIDNYGPWTVTPNPRTESDLQILQSTLYAELQKQFRNDLKHSFKNPNIFYGNEAHEFVENGIYRLDSMKSLNDFNAVITTATKYGEESLTGLMAMIV